MITLVIKGGGLILGKVFILKKEMFFFFDAKLRFALLASFRYENNKPKRSEANKKNNSKHEEKIRVKIKLSSSSTRSFASRYLLIFLFASLRFGSFLGP